jgi:hypothetical protein
MFIQDSIFSIPDPGISRKMASDSGSGSVKKNLSTVPGIFYLKIFIKLSEKACFIYQHCSFFSERQDTLGRSFYASFFPGKECFGNGCTLGRVVQCTMDVQCTSIAKTSIFPWKKTGMKHLPCVSCLSERKWSSLSPFLNCFFRPGSGSRGPKKHWIPYPDPQHWFTLYDFA